jgi:hypothetical protein
MLLVRSIPGGRSTDCPGAKQGRRGGAASGLPKGKLLLGTPPTAHRGFDGSCVISRRARFVP